MKTTRRRFIQGLAASLVAVQMTAFNRIEPVITQLKADIESVWMPGDSLMIPNTTRISREREDHIIEAWHRGHREPEA